MLPTRLPDGSIRVTRRVGDGTEMIGDAPVVLKKGDPGFDKEDRWLTSRGK